MTDIELVLRTALTLTVIMPLLASIGLGLVAFARTRAISETEALRAIGAGLRLSLLGSVVAAVIVLADLAPTLEGEVGFGAWLRIGNYEIPAVLLVDAISVTFSLLAAALTTLVARFSRTYMHRDRGFVRFFVLLGLFASGVQLVALAGALDVMFAGWELIGIASTLLIGFFHDRVEPVRSSLRAFATYRFCDAGFLLAIVATHELIGSTRLAALTASTTLSSLSASILAGLFLLAALGKSAQLPFSGWLPRAMEGPTPSSALFYGGVSIHAGVYLLLRVSPVLEVAPIVEVLGVVFGLSTAAYATLVARTNTDAKGALAHATLAQVGLILAEISAGLVDLALFHLVGHALLRAWQYLRAPNAIHDAHRIGHGHQGPTRLGVLAPVRARWLYASAIQRFHLDESIDRMIAPILWLARRLDRLDQHLLSALSVGERERPGS